MAGERSQLRQRGQFPCRDQAHFYHPRSMRLPLFPLLRRVGGGLLTAACFVGAFGGSAHFIGARLPFPDVPEAGEKHRWFAEHGDRYDTIFLGSSRVRFQIVPAVFNQRAAELGHPLTSFNAGVSAMNPPEDAFFFDHLMRAPHPRLRWVFVELMPVWLKADAGRRNGGRLAYWHDWERSVIMWESFTAELAKTRKLFGKKSERRKPWIVRLALYREPVELYWEHVRLWLQCATNLGAAIPFTTADAGGSPSSASVVEDGWVRHPDTMEGAALADYQDTYAERLKTPQIAKPGNPAGATALRRMLDKVARAGATPVLVIPPTTSPTRFEPPADIQQSCIVLDFSDPRKYPELFAPVNRLDSTHLSAAGAPVYSRLVAERFAAALAARR